MYDSLCFHAAKPLNFEEVYNQSSATNCTVYCGGILNGLTGKCFDEVCCFKLRELRTRAFSYSKTMFISLKTSQILKQTF